MAKKPAFFQRDGDNFMPTGMARSPWSADAINGVAIGGLLAHLIDLELAGSGKHVARFGIDILGEVPRGGVETRTRVTRKGSRVSIVEAELIAGDRVGARATALCVATRETMTVVGDNPFPHYDAVEPGEFFLPGFFGGAPETRPLRGKAMNHEGPGTVWIK